MDIGIGNVETNADIRNMEIIMGIVPLTSGVAVEKTLYSDVKVKEISPSNSGAKKEMKADLKKIKVLKITRRLWQREEVKKSGTNLSSGKIDIYYYSPNGTKITSKPQLARHIGDVIDISTFDFYTGKINSNSSKRNNNINISGNTSGSSFSTNLPYNKHQLDISRNMRTDISLIPPIRQTASIFKQPITLIKNHEGGKVKHDSKNGLQEKPKQLFWEKRLEGLIACNITGEEYDKIELPKGIKPVGPNVFDQTVLQSVATALHVSNQPVTGQSANKQNLQTNSGAFLNPDQPLMHAITVNEDDIRLQEEKVTLARKRLQEALKA